jgi:gamma-glutamylcysteine synthetase
MKLKQRYRYHQVMVAGQAQAAMVKQGYDPRNSADAAAQMYRWKVGQATERRHVRMRKFVEARS